MKLQQLHYALEVFRHNLNISEAVDMLFTSQPGISKQIRLLGEELGVQIFIRSGKHVVSMSQPGEAILELSGKILHDVQNTKNTDSEFTDHDSGSLTIATTRTQARCTLPETVAQFARNYPEVQLTIKQGSPSTTAQMVSGEEADIGIITEAVDDYPELCRLPCYEWNHAVIVPQDHPLLDCHHPLSLRDLASFPLVTYEFAFNNGSSIARAFTRTRLEQPDVALSAADTDVLKTYVELGLGVGVMAKVAYNPQTDQDLQLVDAAHPFRSSPTWIALRPDTYLRGYAYDFINLFAPRLNHEAVNRILYFPIMEDCSVQQHTCLRSGFKKAI